MSPDKIYNELVASCRCDIQFESSVYTATDKGHKLSLQGKTIEDSVSLYRALYVHLNRKGVPFKVGTLRRTYLKGEQSNKLMTIYCPDDMDINELAEFVYSKTMDYKGWYDIKTPTSYKHYAGCVFIGNDRDSSGVYIPVKNR